MSDSEEERTEIFKGVKFFLHQSFTLGQLQALTRKIVRHGGTVLNDEENEGTPDTILVGEEARPRVADRYFYSRKTWVEDPKFVDRCIKRGTYAHEQITFKNMGGRAPGAIRAQFTLEEDIRLAEFLAQLIPDKATGGRTGVTIYKILCSNFEDGAPRYEWAKNHPWQSWRQRYGKKQAYFDDMIENILVVNPPDPSGKGQYMYRRFGAMNVRQEESEGEEEEKEEEEEEDELDVSDDNRAAKSGQRVRRKPRRIDSDDEPGSPNPNRERKRQRRERTEEAQIAGPSRSQKDRKNDAKNAGPGAVVDIDDAPFAMDMDDGGFEQDMEFPTQATLVQLPPSDKGKRPEKPPRKLAGPPEIREPSPAKPSSRPQGNTVDGGFEQNTDLPAQPAPIQLPPTDKGKLPEKPIRKLKGPPGIRQPLPFEPPSRTQMENPTQATLIQPPPSDKGMQRERSSYKSDGAPGIRKPLSFKPPSGTQLAVVITEPPPRVIPPRSISEEIPIEPVRKPESVSLSQSSPTLSKSARKTPTSSLWPPSARVIIDSDRVLNAASDRIPLVTERIQAVQIKKENQTELNPKGTSRTSDAPYRNTRGRSRTVEPVPLPMPQRRAGKGTEEARAGGHLTRGEPLSIKKIEEEDDRDVLMNAQSVGKVAREKSASEVGNSTVESTTTQGNRSVDLAEVEKALIEAEEEEEEADSQAGSDSEDDSIFLAAQAGAKALLSGQRSPSSQLPNDSVDEVEDTIIITSGRKRSMVRPIEEIQLGLRDYSSATDDAFPSPGTRALDEKNRRKGIQKRGRYMPPPGTKAALRMRNTNVKV
ncbi:hypothetical protein SCHPADRAFT_50172 [Schizopora paradoxa]|uniref:BRCT domain-containing protein n=1 Tax=Schizopora paradoxa TaxID=27342 RepID=A0A0H2S5R6_9AGAM|nr:hypothetical protein SCHPADRAFT_50172 [Schizopora paradoxa]